MADIVIAERQVEIALSANLFELDLVLTLDRNLNATVEPDELEVNRAEILDYLRRTVSVSAAGEALPLEAGRFTIGRGADGKALFESTLRFSSARPLGNVVIRCEPLGDLGADHTTLARITAGGRTEQFAFRRGVAYEAGADALDRFAQFLRLGTVHIFTGYDHLAFLVGLLLTGGGFVRLLKIVTAFTVAHSVTLSLAALGVVAIPAAVVEAGIALSIVWVALENLFWPYLDRRWLVSFLFGLVHGFGFAAILAEMRLGASALAASLFSFNLGVELGQAAIVLTVVPVLAWVARTRAHQVTTRSLSALLLSLGLFWLWERVL
jgi:hypothetical protein